MSGMLDRIRAATESNMARHNKRPKSMADRDHVCIPLDEIDPNPFQPRRDFDEEKLKELASTIEAHGLYQPIGLRRVGARYQIVFGERRYRAHQMLGRASIEAFLIEQSDQEMAVAAILENFERDDLSDYETAIGFRNVQGLFDTKTALAEALKIERSDLYRYLDFFDLPAVAVAALEVNHSLFSRVTASKIKSVFRAIESSGGDASAAEALLKELLGKLANGEISQADIEVQLKNATPSRPAAKAPAAKLIDMKLTQGKKGIGSVVKTDKELVVKLKASSISPEKEAELLRFLETIGGQ